MINLFLDTCHHNLIVAIYKDSNPLKIVIEDSDRNLSERLLPIIRNAVSECNLNIKDIDLIIVANGPGSFTGIRIATTVAKTMAYALDCKITTISELKVMATHEHQTDYIASMIDARRDYVYAALYDKKGNAIIEDSHILYDEFVQRVKDITSLDNVTFVSYETYEALIVQKPVLNITLLMDNIKDMKEISAHLVNPNYLKKTEAEEKLQSNV